MHEVETLRIDSLALAGHNGRIGMCCCPGRSHPLASSPGWRRDLRADLDAIRTWDASMLVTLMESFEMQEYGVADLPERAAERGLDWMHLPIRDMDIPAAGFARQWRESGADLRARLRRGESVVIHCLGGLGRTGMIAACLLTEFGMQAEQAIRAVRQVRPGTLQTRAQEDWVRHMQSL